MKKPNRDLRPWAFALVAIVIVTELAMVLTAVWMCEAHAGELFDKGRQCAEGKLPEIMANLLATAIAFAAGVMTQYKPERDDRRETSERLEEDADDEH